MSRLTVTRLQSPPPGHAHYTADKLSTTTTHNGLDKVSIVFITYEDLCDAG